MIFADHQNNKKTLLNDAYDCYVLDQSIFYIQNYNLYCLTIDDQMNKVDNKKIKENVNHFSIDDQSQRILYENLNYKNQLIDFNGNVLKKMLIVMMIVIFLMVYYIIVLIKESIMLI